MAVASQNVTTPPPFKWSGPKRRAAELLAADELTDEQVAAAVGTERRTLARWKLHPDFAAAVQAGADALGEVARRYAVGRRAARVRALQDRWDALRQVIGDRATAPEMQAAPGGATGLLCRTVKGVGSGENFQLVEEYEVDTGLLRELREHEKQAAQELGQWTEHRDVTSGGQPFKVYVGFNPDEV